MPYDPQSGWFVRPASAWRTRITSAIQDEGTEVDSEGALAGVVQGVATMAERSDQEALLLVSQQDPRQMVGTPLASLASGAGVAKRSATSSIATLTVTASAGAVSYPVGYELKADSIVDGVVQVLRWTVVATTAIPASPSTTTMQVQCVETGPVTLDTVSPTTFSAVTPIEGIASTVYATANAFTLGKVREQDPSLRRRTVNERSTTLTGRLVTAIANIDWATTVSVTSPTGTTGVLRVVVVPGPPTSDDKATIAQAIADNIAPGIGTTGAQFDTSTPAGGTDSDQYYWDVGSTQTVAVAVVATPASGYTVASLTTPIVDAVAGAFATLAEGDTIRYVDVIAAVAAVDGLTTFTLTLDAGTANVTPSVATDILTPSTTVT